MRMMDRKQCAVMGRTLWTNQGWTMARESVVMYLLVEQSGMRLIARMMEYRQHVKWCCWWLGGVGGGAGVQTQDYQHQLWCSRPVAW